MNRQEASPRGFFYLPPACLTTPALIMRLLVGPLPRAALSRSVPHQVGGISRLHVLPQFCSGSDKARRKAQAQRRHVSACMSMQLVRRPSVGWASATLALVSELTRESSGSTSLVQCGSRVISDVVPPPPSALPFPQPLSMCLPLELPLGLRG